MTRNGKIARLPRHIRDELNRRLDNGEPGVRLLEWLNSLPEVQEIIKTLFDNHPISDSNLTEWKQGGFLDWQAQRESLADLRELKAEGKELAQLTAGLADDMEAIVLARYATTLRRANGEITEDVRARLQCHSNSLRDVVRFRRCEHSRERVQIRRESLELKRAHAENRKNGSLPRPSPDAETLTQEEKDRRLNEWLYPRDLFPERYEDQPTQQPQQQNQTDQPPSNDPQ